MAISRLTALIIKTNEVNVETYCHPDEKGNKTYGFVVSRMEGNNYRILLNSEPTHYSEKKAKEEGSNLVKKIKTTDLSEFTG